MTKSSPLVSSRRNFLKTLGFVSIGFPLFGNCLLKSEGSSDQNLPGSLHGYPNINSWIRVLDNGNVQVLTGKVELGQGIRTAIMQMAAEELNMNMDLIEIVMADTQLTPNEGYTVGSRSIETSAMAVRYAAAAAREKILELASQKLGYPQESLKLKDGIIYNLQENKKTALKEVLDGRQIEDEVKLPVKLRDKKEYRFVGKAIRRDDVEKMVRGEGIFVHDLQFPGMVHARVIRPSGYSSRLLKYDKEKVQSLPGVLKVVENGSFLAVVAKREYEAIKAQALFEKNSDWYAAEEILVDGSLKEYIKKLPIDSSADVSKGNLSFAGQTTHKASYFKPYIMHASMGPSCAVALYEKGSLTIWSHSQGIFSLREAISGMVGLEEEKIHIVGVPGAGCYGHNGADDVAAEAALIAMSFPGKHLKLQWTREEENGWEPFGSAMIMELEAGLENGKIANWKYDLWSDGHSTRPGGNPANLLPARYIKNSFDAPGGGFRGGAVRNAEPYYEILNIGINSHIFHGPLRISALRSLGAYANIFAIESFMDELAEKAEKDPLDFRIAHLSDKRAIECIEKLRGITNKVKIKPSEGLGFAFSRYKNSAAYCAVAALVATEPGSSRITLKNMWATVDAGEIINPDGVKNQIEGGMVQSASWTLMEEVKFNKKHISSLNWASYPVLRYDEAPITEVAVIDRPYEEPLGAGEASQGPAAAAIANAVYRASGKRIRDLPLNGEQT